MDDGWDPNCPDCTEEEIRDFAGLYHNTVQLPCDRHSLIAWSKDEAPIHDIDLLEAWLDAV